VAYQQKKVDMTEHQRLEDPYPGATTGMDAVVNELANARGLTQHLKSNHSSEVSSHLLELLDCLVDAGYGLVLSTRALESKVFEES
jgi:hypothetical protein